MATPTVQARALVLVLAASLAVAIGVYREVIPDPHRPSATQSSGERLILPTLAVPANPSYQFLQTQPHSSEPVAFDPCRSIHFVVRPTGRPPEGAALIDEAIGNISAATGLQFIDDGATAEAPSVGRPNYLPDRYGDRWAPVLIAWSTPAEFADLTGAVVGVASGEPVSTDDDQLARVSGQVVLDEEQLTEILKFTSGRALAVATVTHELGHLVGLAHVTDERQLMYPSARPLVNTLGGGDLTGLKALGTGRCFDDL